MILIDEDEGKVWLKHKFPIPHIDTRQTGPWTVHNVFVIYWSSFLTKIHNIHITINCIFWTVSLLHFYLVPELVPNSQLSGAVWFICIMCAEGEGVCWERQVVELLRYYKSTQNWLKYKDFNSLKLVINRQTDGQTDRQTWPHIELLSLLKMMQVHVDSLVLTIYKFVFLVHQSSVLFSFVIDPYSQNSTHSF